VARDVPQTIPQVAPKCFSDSAVWQRDLPGGLPPDFDYGLIKTIEDAEALIFILPTCDRGQAAIGLHGNRHSIGAAAAYGGIMAAWDRGHQEIVDAFGSCEKFVAALRHVAPPLDSKSPKYLEVWRGAVVNTDDVLSQAFGASWTRSRSIACWFALRDYVPALQPSRAPLVLHAHVDQSAIVARHTARAEQEVIVDVKQLLLAKSTIRMDGTDITFGDVHVRFADLDINSVVFDQLIAGWRLASARFEHWKNWITLKRRSASRHTGEGW
jgi:hypothetical protein